MYCPPAFDVHDTDEMLTHVDTMGFGHLVVVDADGRDATPLPMLVRPDGAACSLVGHVARANRLWRRAPCTALVIVPGADAYVSPSWYPSKAEHGAVVPTWNYEVVHAHGRLVAHDDSVWVERLVRDLTARHESTRPAPWSLDDAPAEFIAKQLRAIVGIEVIVDRWEGKRKLSQNRSEQDRRGVVDGLVADGDARSRAVAERMTHR